MQCAAVVQSMRSSASRRASSWPASSRASPRASFAAGRAGAPRSMRSIAPPRCTSTRPRSHGREHHAGADLVARHVDADDAALEVVDRRERERGIDRFHRRVEPQRQRGRDRHHDARAAHRLNRRRVGRRAVGTERVVGLELTLRLVASRAAEIGARRHHRAVARARPRRARLRRRRRRRTADRARVVGRPQEPHAEHRARRAGEELGRDRNADELYDPETSLKEAGHAQTDEQGDDQSRFGSTSAALRRSNARATA